MSIERRRELRRLEGLSVHLALADGSRLDDVMLVSGHGAKVWVFDNGADVFIALEDVIDFWTADRMRSAA